MASSEWLFPRTTKAALAELEIPDTTAVAGGTTVLDLLKLGFSSSSRLVDLSRLDMREIAVVGRNLHIGAMVTNSTVARSDLVLQSHPALSEAILMGASEQIRNAASVGGNLMQACRCSYFRATDWPCNRRQPGSGCPAISSPMAGHAVLGTSPHCIATHPSDMAVAMLALDAMVTWKGQDNEGVISVSDFYRLPGKEPHLLTHLPEGALITGVELPRTRAARNSGYLKLRGRASYEFASASVAAALELACGEVCSVAIAFGGVATVPWRDHEAEATLLGRPLSTEATNEFLDRIMVNADLRSETIHKIGLARGALHHLLERLARS